MRKSVVISLVIIILSFIISTYFYSGLPESMPSHWNAAGEVDGYMPKFWVLFLMPIVTLGLLGLFVVLPGIDPLKRNWPGFRKYYDGFIVLFTAFMFYMHLIVLTQGMGMQYNVGLAMLPAMAALFYYCGILVENAKQNWFVGIRTPWTLSSTKVWNKTHKRGGKLFKACGVIALIGILAGGYAIWFVIVPIIAVSVYLIVYSFWEYRKEKK